jgi:hypothetical protein
MRKVFMGDRVFLLLIGIFVLTAVFAYDRIVTQRGEIGPVARLMDYAGLSKSVQNGQEQGESSVSHHEVQSQIRNNMVNLQEAYHQIDSQREALIHDRQAILQRLLEINDQIMREAQVYTRVLEEESHALRSRFPGLEELVQMIIQTRRLEDPQLREEHLAAIKQKLLDFSSEAAGDYPLKDVSGSREIIEKIEKYVLARDELAEDLCASGNGCLAEALDDIEKEIDRVARDTLVRSQKNSEELIQLTETLKKEYAGLADNMRASDDRYDTTNQSVESELQSLTQALVEITQDDLQKLMTLYQALVREHRVLMENLDLHHQRVELIQQKANQRLEDILRAWRPIARLKNPSSGETTEALLAQLSSRRLALLEELAGNDQQMRGLHSSRWEVNQHFADSITAYLPKAEWIAPEYQAAGAGHLPNRSSPASIRVSLTDPPAARRSPSEGYDHGMQRTAGKPGGLNNRRLQVMEQKRQQDQRLQNSQEQYERLRRQTKYNEEYLKKNLHRPSTTSP